MSKTRVKVKFRRSKWFIVIGVTSVVVLASVGTVGALNGWFGGGESIPSDTFTRGLVGYWPFEEGSGGQTSDISGNNTGTLTYMSTSTNAWTAGKLGGALNFDGTDDYVNIGNVGNVRSVEFWINNSNATDGILELINDAVYISISGSAITATGFTSSAIYVNGSSASASLSAGWNHVVITDTADVAAASFLIGEANNDFTAGIIDEVRIYNRALSAAEVKYHYNRGGPVAQWKFDEGSGSTVYDSTDNNNDITIPNSTQMATSTSGSSGWTAGKYGTALSFDGIDDYVKSNANLTGVSQFSYSLWFKSSDGAYSADEYLLSQGTNDPSIFIESTDNKIYVMADNANKLTSNTTVNDTKWHYAQITADGTTIKLYLDGAFQSQTSYTGSSVTGIFYISTSTSPFGGIIDDVRVYNYVRTPDEIRLDYNSGFGVRFGPLSTCDDDPGSCMTQGLVGYWNFEEGSGGQTSDISGNNTGTLTYMSTSTNAWTAGKLGGALNFDGTDDYVNIGNVGNVRSVEFWINNSNATDGILELINDAVYISISGSAITATGFTSSAIYVNGSSASASLSAGWNHVVITDTADVAAASFLIGEANNDFTAGIIDEVRIYNRALSAAEVRYHYNRGAPVVQWKFDEGNGATVYDSTENNNDGAIPNSTQMTTSTSGSSGWVAGKYGTALAFDGTNDYVKSNTNLTGISQFSYSLWFKSSDGAYSADEYLFSQGTNDPSIFIESTDNKIYVMADNANKLTSNTTVNDTKWHYAQITADGTTIKLYLDGAFQSQTSYTGSSVTGIFYISTSTSPFGGIIDDVRIYNYARGPDEIKLDYNSGFGARFGPLSTCDDDPGSCITQGLVGYWPFDEGGGSIVYDESNFRNDGNLIYMTTNTNAWVKGKVGGALQFEPNDDYVSLVGTCAADNPLKGYPIRDITITAWVKLDPTFSAQARLFGLEGSGVSFYVLSGGQLRGRIVSGIAVNLNGSTALNTNQWYFVAMTYDGSKIAVFLNAKSDGSAAQTGNINNSNSQYQIGGYWTSCTTNINETLKGVLDEVRYYNRVLSLTELRYLYNRGGPVAHWKFNDGSGQIIYDSTENNNDGTLASSTDTTSADPAWTAGKYGSALSFDGSNDYARTTGNLTTASQFSHSLWFKSSDGTYSVDEYLLSQGTNDPSIFIESTDNKIYVMADNANKLSSNTTINDTKWHYVQITADGITIKLYLDGVFQSQTPYTGSSATSILYVGSNASLAQNFGGIIDEVRVYNYARTPAQIQQDHNSGFSSYFR